MKILIDENIDVRFKNELSLFDTQTVKDKGWTGIKNGKLLELAAQNEYDVFITLDSNIKHQQKLSKYKLHILIIKAKTSRLNHLKLFIPKIQNLIYDISDKTMYEVIEVLL